METSASFEARSAPSPYPAANPFNNLRLRIEIEILHNFVQSIGFACEYPSGNSQKR